MCKRCLEKLASSKMLYSVDKIRKYNIKNMKTQVDRNFQKIVKYGKLDTDKIVLLQLLESELIKLLEDQYMDYNTDKISWISLCTRLFELCKIKIKRSKTLKQHDKFNDEILFKLHLKNYNISQKYTKLGNYKPSNRLDNFRWKTYKCKMVNYIVKKNFVSVKDVREKYSTQWNKIQSNAMKNVFFSTINDEYRKRNITKYCENRFNNVKKGIEKRQRMKRQIYSQIVKYKKSSFC